jgi:hypothetical protein
MSLGRHIWIERSLSPVQHYVRNALSGSITLVTIHPDRRALFSVPPEEGWCTFQRKDQHGFFVCIIYENRPPVCRDFRCRTLVITGRDGREVGHISGRASLTTEDPALEVLWRDLNERIPVSSPGWLDQVRTGLRSQGYSLEPLT